MNKIPIPIHIYFLCEKIACYGGKAKIVGGYVRDALNGILQPNTEIDLATTLLPKDVIQLCNDNALKAIPTGIEHGTITVIINNITIEITTLRSDVRCYGRHADVVFGNNWEEDAARRDCTINAIYADINGTIYDYFNGQSDLRNSIVKFIGDPVQRIHEDYLRIMRYFRFLGYFESILLDHKSFHAATMLASNLQFIAAERIKSELIKICISRYPLNAIKLMIEHNIFMYLKLDALNQISAKQINHMIFCDDPIINLTALFKIARMPDLSILHELRFSINEQKKIKNLLQHSEEQNQCFINIQSLNEAHNMMQKIGKQEYINSYKMSCVLQGKVADQITQLHSIELKTFPINGTDIMQLGYQGPKVGEYLKRLKNLWLNSDCELNKEQLTQLLL